MKAKRFGISAGLAIAAAVTSGALLAQAPQPIGTWVSVGEVNSSLATGAVVALPDKGTLITGGMLSDGTITDAVTIYDAVDNSTTVAGTLTSARADHTATLLNDGRVLVVGGMSADGLVSSDIEVFDPATGTSTIVALLPEPRSGHVAAALPDGTVLIAGGATLDGVMLQTAVLFDPATASVSSVPGQLHVARVHASATTLLDGRVLVAGGSNGTADLASAEIYDRFSQSFSIAATQMSVGRQGHSAVLLPDNGGVLVAGGTSNGVAQAGVDLFLPAVFPDPFSYGEGEFAQTGAMTAARTRAVAGPTSVEGFAFAAAGGSPDAEVYRFATIKTDTDDYAPGQLALITGSGWQPNEEVTLLFQEDPAVHEDYVLKVNADVNGNIFWNQWAPEHHDLGVRFYLTATGSQSRAQVTFTDAAATAVSLVSGANPSLAGQSVTFTASVTSSGAAATLGSVEFRQGGANCGNSSALLATVPLNASGQASSAVTLATAGNFVIRACYQGSGGDFQKSDTSVTQTVNGVVATNTVVSSSSNPSTFGNGVSFTAIVTRTSGTGSPTGSVQFKIDGANFGAPVALGAPSSTTSATAVSGSISTLTTTTHTVEAIYIPSAGFTASSDLLDGGQLVNKANAVCTITGYTGTYDAAPHGASGSCTGVAGDPTAAGSSLNPGASFTNAPGGTANWSFTGGANYNNQSGSVAIVINRADAVCTITGYTGTYDAASHGASGSCVGVAGDATAAGSSLNLGATYTDAPGGTANWSFTGGANYNDQSGSVEIVINKADANVVVNGYTGIYDATAHGATGSATGVNGVDLSASLDFGESFANVPGGTANWTFNGGTNYNDQSGTVDIVINRADASVSVTGYTGTFDGNAHGASGTATGVGGVNLASGLDLGATFTNAPGGTAHWTFSDGNYNPQSGDVEIVINKASSTTTVSCPASVTYTGAAQTPCTVTVEGAGGLNDTMTASYTDNVNAGTATASYTFAGDLNHLESADSTTFVINKANAVVTVSGYTGVYDGQSHGATGTVVGVMGETLAGLNLGAGFVNVPGGTAHWTFTDQTGNYNDDGGNVAIVINKADPTVTVKGYSGVYNGQPHGAYGHVNGVLKETLAGLNLGETFTNVPGGIAHWTFVDQTGNYNDKSGEVEIVIAKANASCSITGYDVIFDNALHTATGTCTGVSDSSLAGLDLSGTSHKLAGVYTDTWTFTDVTGNYNDTSGTVIDRIGHWTTSGFYQPVEMSGSQLVWNTVKGGSTVPLKFNLYAGTVKRTSVEDVLSFALAPMECGISSLDATVEFTTTGGTTLRYDGTAGQYIQNWQTPKLPGRCFVVQLTALDGSTINAYFKLK